MITIPTFAIIGITQSWGFNLVERIAAKYRVLLFDRDTEKMNQACHQILEANPLANVEAMICPTDASWEADTIVLGGDCCACNDMADKINEVVTGKIVLIISDAPSDDIFSNPAGNFQHSLPYSKVIQVFNANDKPDKNDLSQLVVEGNDAAALATVASIFESIGFTTVVSITHSIIN